MTPASLLQHDAFLSPLAIEEAVQRALEEDLGRAGDITSIATIPESTRAHAIMVARQSGRDRRVAAGGGDLPKAVAGHQHRSPCPRRRHGRGGEPHLLTISGPGARGAVAANAPR